MDEPIIIEAGGKPTAMYVDGKLWLSLSRLGKSLGLVNFYILLAGETRMLGKRDGGIYAPLDDVVALVPQLKDHWIDAKARYMQAIEQQKT